MSQVTPSDGDSPTQLGIQPVQPGKFGSKIWESSNMFWYYNICKYMYIYIYVISINNGRSLDDLGIPPC